MRPTRQVARLSEGQQSWRGFAVRNISRSKHAWSASPLGLSTPSLRREVSCDGFIGGVFAGRHATGHPLELVGGGSELVPHEF